MPIQNAADAAAAVLLHVPEFRPTYDEHVSDFDGEVLLHLLLPDLARFAVAAERAGDLALVDRALAAADQLFVEGDDEIENAVAVSFVEHLDAESEPGEREVLARFPPSLAEELQRQRAWRPSSDASPGNSNAPL